MKHWVVSLILVLPIPLCLAATEDRIELLGEWSFAPDPKGAGLEEGWQKNDFEDTGWARIGSGHRWEEQGYPDLDGQAWYRRWVEVPKDWGKGPVWLVLGGANDAFTLYCNGTEVASFGDRPDAETDQRMNVTEKRSVAEVATVAELGSSLSPGQPNLIALRFTDWGGSGGPWREPFFLTTDHGSLPQVPECHVYYSFQERGWFAEIDPAGLGTGLGQDSFEVSLTAANRTTSKAPTRVSRERTGEVVAFFQANPNTTAPGTLLRVAPGNPSNGKASPLSATLEIPLPVLEPLSWPGNHSSWKILNSFVTELASQEITSTKTEKIEFENPREGWVFFSLSPSDESAHGLEASAVLDNTREVRWRTNPENGAAEAMWELALGKHILEVTASGPARVTIRAIPEIAYSYYPGGSNLKPNGPFDWDYLTKHVLPHVNTLISAGGADPAVYESWKKEGRKWLGNAGLPGLAGPPPAADEVYQAWADNIGVQSPHFGGMIVDEFIGASPAHFSAWLDAVRLLRRRHNLSGKHFYAWCGDLYQQQDVPTRSFLQDLLAHNDRFAVEKYLPEPPTEEEIDRSLFRSLHRSLSNWGEKFPDFKNHLVLCLGYMSAPPESLDTNPGVDYRVFLDRQFRHLATEPAYFGMYGLMEYTTSYADEEVVRWAHRLFRHYCIEGNISAYTRDPYELPHLENPDFSQGLAGWEAREGAEGSLSTASQEGFSWLEGRYPETERGDTFARMIRSKNRPNTLRQTLRALKPGRLYSIRLIASDLSNMDKNQELSLHLGLEGGVWKEDYGYRVAYPSCYAHSYGSYNRDHPAYFTYYRHVFEAEGSEATFTLSDWDNEANPGGPIGQTIGCNFVQVQPFLAP